MGIESVSLSQLVSDVKITLQSRYELPVWIVAEISELNFNRTGHCYLELIEKDTLSDKIVAKSRATIWAFTFRNLKPYFETSTGETLRSGLKVLVKATVEFHEVFGFSLNILDIDPQYTMGDLARKKAQIIQQLTDEGVIDMNNQLPFPLVPQRIAVISSETAAGYGDFVNQLAGNSMGYAFFTELFPSLMQGEKAGESIIQAFENIYNRIHEFDVVAIIRGGGSKSDLHCFNDYNLAYFITQFPLPVLTGIGHERDDTIVDMVAHTKLKTPTALAGFLIDNVAAFDHRIDGFRVVIADVANQRIDEKQYELQQLTRRLQRGSATLVQSKYEHLIWAKSKLINGVQFMILKNDRRLKNLINSTQIIVKSSLNNEFRFIDFRKQRLKSGLSNYFVRKNKHLDLLSEKAEFVNPQRLLERGFAIVTHLGKVITQANQLKTGDAIEVKMANGKVEAEVINLIGDREEGKQ